MISKTESGKWLVDIRLSNGQRKRKTLRTLAEAKQFLHFAKSQSKDSPWTQTQKQDSRKLSELISLWYDSHGRTLESGEERKGRLLFIADLLNDPTAKLFTSAAFAELRAKRLAEGIKPNTLNHDLAHLRALYGELLRLGQIDYSNPLESVRGLKVQPPSLRVLERDEIKSLLAELTGSPAYLVTKVCLSIGARWSEAQDLRAIDLIEPNLLRLKGKNNKYRFLPVAKDLFADLKAIERRPMFPRTSYDDFRRAVEALRLDLPKGQLTHVLRHTFATTFLRKTSDLKSLQSILDHSNIAVTSRYLHAMPDHAQSVLTSNALVDL